MSDKKSECQCDKVVALLKQTDDASQNSYSKYKEVNADFTRTIKAMFYEKVRKIYSNTKQ
jgi:hypothetical protein